jgi:hypothetical protein
MQIVAGGPGCSCVKVYASLPLSNIWLQHSIYKAFEGG